MTSDKVLFPPVEPYRQHALDVGGGHSLYVEECGRADGIAAVFLHGGPGSGCQEWNRRLFDPEKFRIILFDQRGCGRSSPKGGLSQNTTQDLVADLEVIRESLGVDRWMVVGGSWGATLGTAYAQTYPDRVTGLVLRAVFLGSVDEGHWAFGEAARMFYPEVWRQFVALLPQEERAAPVLSYGRRMESADENVAKAAAWVWHDYERILSVLTPEDITLPKNLEAAARRQGSPSTPFFEWHYMKNDFFLEDGQLVKNAKALQNVPGIIVQGQYDLLCPPRTAAALAQSWGNCDLRIVPGAGHSVGEPGITEGLVRAINDLT